MRVMKFIAIVAVGFVAGLLGSMLLLAVLAILLDALFGLKLASNDAPGGGFWIVAICFCGALVGLIGGVILALLNWSRREDLGKSSPTHSI